MSYNLSCYDNVTNAYYMYACGNEVSGGYLFPLTVMFTGFIILFIAFKNKYDIITSMIGSSFIIGIVGVLGWAINLVDDKIVFIPVILLAGSVIAYMLSD